MAQESILVPAEILPHKPPFLFVDGVTSMEPGTSISGWWDLTGDEAFFGGHFPGRPTLPGVLMVEALAQLGAIVVLSDERFTSKLPLFGGVDNARFRRQVVPGDRLNLSVQVSRLSGRAGKASGEASVDGERACGADLLFVVVDA